MQLTGAQIVIETLLEQGANTVFGYPGGYVINIYDELYKYGDKIKHIVTSHEQGAAHAADGYARASGKVGVVLATSGPGATNLVTGIAAAYLDSVPMVAITGNVPCDLLGRDSFQEVDICGITMPVTKHNFIVKDVNLLADTLRRAFAIARTGRPGPVLVDIPKDVQQKTAEFVPQAVQDTEGDCKSDAGFEGIEKALSMLAESKKPFIYAGGGIIASNAGEELMRFADLADAPVGASMMGLSAVHCQNPRFLGMTGMHGTYAANKIMAESDLVIAVGTRFSDRATGNKKMFSEGHKFIHIDIDPAEIGKNIQSNISLVGDVKAILSRLICGMQPRELMEWRALIAEVKAHPDGRLKMDASRLNPENLIKCVSANALPDSPVATDVGQHQMWTAQYYGFKTPRTFITSGGLGAMGFGLGAAIGAATATKKRTVLFTSDGSFHMNMNELATAVSQNLPVTVIVLNNNALGMVRQWQTLFFNGRYSNTSLQRKTDYVKLAQAFGMRASRISATSELEDAVKTSLSGNEPYLLEVIIDSDEKVLPMIPPSGSINDIILKS